MSTFINIGLHEELFKIEIRNNIAIATFGKNLFSIISDIEKNSKILEAFKELNDDPALDAIIIANDENSWNEKFYRNFLQEISGMDFKHEKIRIDKFAQHLSRSREIIFLQRIIFSLLNSSKITIAAVQGEVVTPAFGAMLAFDFRIMSEDARFSLAHTKFGLHPSGALPFFLQKYIGLGRSVDLLMRGGLIEAKEAKELGLINQVVPKEELIEKCIDFTNNLTSNISYSIRPTKMLSFNFNDELKHYFNMESKLII